MAKLFRARWLLIPLVLILVIGGYAGWKYLSKWESTDDAQVDGHIHPVNARVGGTAISVEVKENEHVDAGALVAQLDPRDYQIAVARAEADLAEARAIVLAAQAGVPVASSSAGTQIISSEAVSERAKGGVEVANKELAVAQAKLNSAQARVREAQANATKAARDLERMKQLVAKDEISQLQYDAAVGAADAARGTVDSAEAGVVQAQQEIAAARARTSQSQAELQVAQAEAQGAKTAPQRVVITKAQVQSAEARVQLATAALDQAKLNLDYTSIKAPVAGIVSRKSIESGQGVQSGQPLMAIVPQEEIWVTANFKETQLAEMHPGQAATVAVDAYGGRILNAHVDSISSATGAKFSLLPPENATGNYVKVVQRIPVKIVFDESEQAQQQLPAGYVGIGENQGEVVDEQSAPVPYVNPWIIAVAVMFGTFMEVLDTTVVNVSLPHIAGSLSVTTEEATWALTSYLVANAIVLPITGFLANYFGRKRLLMSAVVGFTASSFMCGFAPNLAFLVVFRIIQGLTGGVLQPVSQAVMLEAFPPAQRGKAMGFWGLGIVVAPMLGPVLGGWLTDNYSWRWVFYVNIPVGIVSIIMTRLFIFDPSYIRRTAAKVDVWGIGMLAVGIAALQIILDKGQQEDWFASHWITGLAILAGVMLVVFIVHELTTADPVLRLRVFMERTYATGVFLMTTLGFVMYGSLVLVPLFLQTVLGYPAIEAGIAMAPRGLGSFISMPVVGFLTAKFDPRKLLGAGLIGGSITLFALGSLNLQVGYWDIFWPQFFQGLSMGLIFVPLTTITMSLIAREEMGNATSIFNLMRNLGGSVGIATIATMLSRNTQTQYNVLGSHISMFDTGARALFDQIRGGFIARGLDFSTATKAAYGTLSGMVSQQAVMVAFVQLFRILALVFAVVIPLVFIMRRPKSGQPAASAH